MLPSVFAAVLAIVTLTASFVIMFKWAPSPAAVNLCAGRTLVAQRQLRGMWVTSVNNEDWPSKQGLDAETLKNEFRGWLDLAQKLNHNAIFVHVRPTGDAFWPSKYVPWSEWLTGTFENKDPGWDPMAFMVEETHKRNLEFHAWFNPYRGSARGGADVTVLAPGHPLQVHPDWGVTFPAKGTSAKLYYNPGVPEARAYVEDSIMEAVNHYDLDGVHFDDFFYPYPVQGQEFGDQATFDKYHGSIANRDDWRRDNVNQLVKEMNQRIKAAKPWVKFGISPFGIWRNAGTDPAGSPTKGLQSYDDIYADTRQWIKQQWIDYVAPQLYWTIGYDIADYAKLVPWWASIVKDTSVQLYIGQADYRIGSQGAWADPAELERQIALNNDNGVNGTVHFTASNLKDDKLGAVSRYTATHHSSPAMVPVMRQLPRSVPSAPIEVTATKQGDSVTLTWQAGGGASPARYAVYRAEEPLPTTSASVTSPGAKPAGARGARPAAMAMAAQPEESDSEQPSILVGTDANPLAGIATPSAGKSPPAVQSKATLVATMTGGPQKQKWIDQAVPKEHGYTYCVTALDRLWNESAASAGSGVH